MKSSLSPICVIARVSRETLPRRRRRRVSGLVITNLLGGMKVIVPAVSREGHSAPSYFMKGRSGLHKRRPLPVGSGVGQDGQKFFLFAGLNDRLGVAGDAAEAPQANGLHFGHHEPPSLDLPNIGMFMRRPGPKLFK